MADQVYSDAELERLIEAGESQWVEFKESTTQIDGIRKTVCAFANDLHNSGQSGVLFVGIRDDGTPAGISIDDRLMQLLSELRSDGTILPQPVLSIERRMLREAEVAVVTVLPYDAPPVRYKNVIYVRVGSTTRAANPADERNLAERRRSADLSYDIRPAPSTALEALDMGGAWPEYLRQAVKPEVLAENQRTPEHQLVSLGLASPGEPPVPTTLGILVVGIDPQGYIPGAYIQFVRYDGLEITDPVKDHKELGGTVGQMLRELDEVFRAHISIGADFTSGTTEREQPDYPLIALQQLARNAVMHRTYESTNAPVRISWFRDRIEIQSPGGPYGQVTPENFGTGVTDYRNPRLAEALRNLGFVQRFGVGIAMARKACEDNGNPPPEFTVEPNQVLVTLRSVS